MFEGYPLIKRVALGKLIGALFGVVGFFLMPVLWPDTGMMMRLAVLFWYITFGASVSMFCLLEDNPILPMKLYWWFLGPYTGAWLNFILMLFIYDKLEGMLLVWPGEGGVWSNPWWIILEGAIIGWLVGYFTNRKRLEVKLRD